MKQKLLALLFSFVLLSGFGFISHGNAADEKKSTVAELEWDELIPVEWQPDKIMDKYNVDELSDDDPRAQELYEALKALWRDAPVVKELDGKKVKLPGFVVPLEMDAKQIDQFLLVPYYGACIHVPPPPSNQTVHVITRKNKAFKGEMFDTVWVTGTLRVQPTTTELADAGYTIENAVTEPYE